MTILLLAEIAEMQKQQLTECIDESEAHWDELFRCGPEPLFEPPTEMCTVTGDWWWAA